MRRAARRTVVLAGCALGLVVLIAVTGFRREIQHWFRWGHPGSLMPTTEDVLWWLPDDTQTVIVNQGPSGFSFPPTDQEPPDLRAALEPCPLNLLSMLDDGAFPEEIAERKLVLSIEGSRKFRAPKSLGLMPYEGCQIFVFADDLGADGDALFRRLETRAAEAIEIEGRRVIVLEEPMESDAWRFHIARPVSNILLAATHRGYLETVLGRMERRAAKRALPEDLPEWKTFDRSARFWAVRHYDPDDASLDPTSPLRPQAAANVPDTKAVGFTFCYDPDSSDVVNAFYLSGERHASRVAAAGWLHPSESLSPTIEEVRPGVVQISASATDPGGARMFLFVLLSYLGHGIYL